MQNSFDHYETWMLSQAQSYLGRQAVTLEEAKELFKKIDITTRQPIPEAGQPRPSGLVAALRAMVSGGMILVLASGCARDIPAPAQEPQYESVANLRHTNVDKFYDLKEGVVCYVAATSNSAAAPAIACMVAKPGDNQ